MLQRLHHAAYRCRDSEETRRFYEGFLGLELVNAFPIGQTKTGRRARVLHSFYEIDDGSCIAFFEAPDEPFEFKPQRDYDVHIAFLVTQEVLHEMFEKGKREGIETRGVSDHGFIHSIYFRDPNGYVVELAAKSDDHDARVKQARTQARAQLDAWQANKRESIA